MVKQFDLIILAREEIRRAAQPRPKSVRLGGKRFWTEMEMGCLPQSIRVEAHDGPKGLTNDPIGKTWKRVRIDFEFVNLSGFRSRSCRSGSFTRVHRKVYNTDCAANAAPEQTERATG